MFCLVLAAAVTSTTSQTAPQPAQAGDDPSPTTMIEEVPFHPLAFSSPCWDSVESNVHTFVFSFTGSAYLAEPKFIC